MNRRLLQFLIWVIISAPIASGSDLQPKAHWAFQPIADPAAPPVTNKSWPKTPLDHFILARLEQSGLQPAEPASRLNLVRRATFDLTGLTPTIEEVDQFVTDHAPDAAARLIDRLLASPRYGERWARHWLDVARYADSNGMDENLAYANAWRYRDYVIDAFNRDKPFNHFIREQLAGDLLAAPGAGGTNNFEQIVATGFLSIGPKMLAEDDPVKMEMDIIDEQVDTISRAFLGLTVGCGRCHDHKYDPIPTTDYYALAGIFKSTHTMDNFKVVARWQERPLGSPSELKTFFGFQRQIEEQNGRIARLMSETNKDDTNRLAALKREREALQTLEKACGKFPQAMAVTDAAVQNLRVHKRGSHLALGDEIPRGFLKSIGAPDLPALGTNASGRLELANWMVQPDHPLTARVIVNRIWHWHFGAGLVRTPDNFGSLGKQPTHPELLDWLARRFIESGWSVKALHRLIMNSAVYQQASQPAARQRFSVAGSWLDAKSNQEASAPAQIEALPTSDPDDQLLSHFRQRRLEVEAIRDAILFVSGDLDLRMGGSLLTISNRIYVTSTASKLDQSLFNQPRRSIYLPVVRSALYDMFQVFDFADPSVLNGARDQTTVAPQALFMLNSKLMADAARHLARTLLDNERLDASKRVVTIYQLAYGRMPQESEVTAALDHVRRYAQAAERYGTKPEESQAKAWQSVVRSVLSANEFIYLE